MKDTMLMVLLMSLLTGCSDRQPEVVREADAKPEGIVTAEYLSDHGFVESEGGPGIFSLLDVRIGDASRDLGFALSDLRPTPNQSLVGSDVRTVTIRNLTFVVRARTTEEDGEVVIESLDHPNSFCTISVALDQAPPEREMTKKGQSPNNERVSERRSAL